MSAFSWLSLRFCRWGWSRVVGPAGEVPACWRGSTLLVQPAVAFGRVSLIGCPSLERDPFTLNKSECSKQALRRSNGSAWNNRRGPASASVGLTEAGNDQEGRTGAEVWLGERGNSWTLARPSRAKASAKDVSIDQERKSRDRTGLDTPVVATVNDANREFDGVTSMTRQAPDPGNRESLGSGWEYGCKAET